MGVLSCPYVCLPVPHDDPLPLPCVVKGSAWEREEADL